MVMSRIVTHKAYFRVGADRQTVHGVPELEAGVFNQARMRAGIADCPSPFAGENPGWRIFYRGFFDNLA